MQSNIREGRKLYGDRRFGCHSTYYHIPNNSKNSNKENTVSLKFEAKD